MPLKEARDCSGIGSWHAGRLIADTSGRQTSVIWPLASNFEEASPEKIGSQTSHKLLFA